MNMALVLRGLSILCMNDRVVFSPTLMRYLAESNLTSNVGSVSLVAPDSTYTPQLWTIETERIGKWGGRNAASSLEGLRQHEPTIYATLKFRDDSNNNRDTEEYEQRVVDGWMDARLRVTDAVSCCSSVNFKL